MRLLRSKNRIWIALILAALLLSACGAQSAPAPTPTPAPTPAPTPEPTPEPTPAPTPAPTEAPVWTAPPEPFSRVDDSFFADAAFLGNSLMDGLRLFGGLRYGDFYSGTSASVISVNTVRDARSGGGAPCTRMEALLEKQYNKIYVLFGINELGFNVDSFAAIYSELLAQIAAGEPNASICVLSLTPITRARDAEDDIFTRARVMEFNAAIADMAQREGYFYLDLYSALADEEGWLPEAQATDGIHFKPSKYVEWADFLREHYEIGERTELSSD